MWLLSCIFFSVCGCLWENICCLPLCAHSRQAALLEDARLHHIAPNLWLLNMSDFSLVDYRIFQCYRSGSVNILCEMFISWGNVWLTDRRSLIKRLICGDLGRWHELWRRLWHVQSSCVSQGIVKTLFKRDWRIWYHVVPHLLKYTCTKNYQNRAWSDKVIAKIKWCSFLTHSVYLLHSEEHCRDDMMFTIVAVIE